MNLADILKSDGSVDVRTIQSMGDAYGALLCCVEVIQALALQVADVRTHHPITKAERRRLAREAITRACKKVRTPDPFTPEEE